MVTIIVTQEIMNVEVLQILIVEYSIVRFLFNVILDSIVRQLSIVKQHIIRKSELQTVN